MKLTEILRVFQRAGLNPKAIKHDTAAIIGNYEGNAIWNIKTTNPDEEIFAIKKDNQIVSQIFGRFWVVLDFLFNLLLIKLLEITIVFLFPPSSFLLIPPNSK
jgi:hypothetical protein